MEIEILELFEDRVIVQELEGESRSPSGLIIIPDTAKEKPQRGIVRIIGPGTEDSPPIEGLKVGDEIYYSKYSGTEIILNHKELLIMRFRDIMGKITKTNA